MKARYTLSTSPLVNKVMAVWAMSSRVLELEPGEEVDPFVLHVEPALDEVVAPAPADQPEHGLTFGVLGDEDRRRLDHVGVEAAGQAAVGGDDDQQRAPAGPRGAALVEQRMRGRVHAARHAVQDPQHLGRERARLLDALLGAAQLRRGDHLHGLGDLLRRFHRPDAAADVQERGHESVPFLWQGHAAAVFVAAANWSPNSLSAWLSCPLISSVSSFFSASDATTSARRVSRNLKSSDS